MRHIPKNTEDGDAGVNGSGAIDHRHNDGVSEAIVGEPVVGRHGDKAAGANAERIEDLHHSVCPHARLEKFIEIGVEVVKNSLKTEFGIMASMITCLFRFVCPSTRLIAVN